MVCRALSGKEAKRTIRETDTRIDPHRPYGPYPGRYSGRRTHRHTITRTEIRPVVKITVDLNSAACEDCLSADDRIREAAEAGNTLAKEVSGPSSGLSGSGPVSPLTF